MEKICSIKLVSGEEIVCNVIEIMEFGTHTSVAIHNPVKISHRSSTRKSSNEFPYKFSEWLVVDKSDLLEINLNKIMTICEVEDFDVLFEYNRYFQKKLKPKPVRQFKKQMGFVGSVEECRKALEKLYKDESYDRDS